MPEDASIFKSKLLKLVIIIVIIIALAVIGSFLYWQTENKVAKPETVTKAQTDAEAEKLKEQNQGIINSSQTAAVASLRPIDETDHVWGDLAAPVQLIIYDDFECPFCADFYSTVRQTKDYFGDQVVIAFRHFPLTIHPLALSAAVASECADEQGKFWEMYDKLFTDNLNNRFFLNQFKNDAADLGLDAPKFNQCLDTEKYLEKVQTQMLEGRNFSITGTPTAFVNGKFLTGAVPFEDFTNSSGQSRPGMKTLIERELSN